MTLGSIPYSVDTLNYRIQRSVISYCGIRTVQIVIYSPRQSDTAQVIILGEKHGSSQRTVTSYHNQCVYLIRLQVFISLLPAFRCKEFF